MKKPIITICFLLLGLNIFNLGWTFQARDTQKLVALTFDDGPTLRYTPDILKILKENEVPATFFLVGKQVEKHPRLAREIVAAGYEVGNHTYTHTHLEYLSYTAVLKEIKKTDQIFKHFLGIEEPIFFRPPRKKVNVQVIYAQEQTQKVMALWTVCGENRNVSTPWALKERVIKNAPDGGVILLHDGGQDFNRVNSVKALPLIIQEYKEKGYKFVTLSQYYDQIKDRRVFK